MKQLIALLCTLVITITLCVNAAEADSLFIKKTSLPQNFTLPENVIEGFNFPKEKVISDHNRFFELSIIFNENLQQFLAYFSSPINKENKIVSNDLSSATKNQASQKCKVSS